MADGAFVGLAHLAYALIRDLASLFRGRAVVEPSCHCHCEVPALPLEGPALSAECAALERLVLASAHSASRVCGPCPVASPCPNLETVADARLVCGALLFGILIGFALEVACACCCRRSPLSPPRAPGVLALPDMATPERLRALGLVR